MSSTPYIGIRQADERSASVKAYLQAAIAPSTRITYAAAFTSWTQFCTKRNIAPEDPITELIAEEWISALADHGRITAATIRTYKAAMGTYHTEHSTLPNPFQTARMHRIITGIENEKAPREAARRRAQPKSDGFTQQHLSIVSERCMQGTQQEIMMAAAAAFMYGAALRPNEAVGSSSKEPIRMDQIEFFAGRESRSAMPIPSSARSNDRLVPHHIVVELHGSKTNQQHREEKVVIIGALAVQMVWRWYRIRHERALSSAPGTAPDPWLFSLPSKGRLTGHTLLSFLHIVAREHSLSPHWTPKCFRIGATSDAHAAGINSEGLRHIGRWRANTWQTYADPQSAVDRAIAARNKQ